MKQVLQSMVYHLVKNDSIWRMLNATIVRAVEHAKWQRAKQNFRPVEDVQSTILSFSPQLIVKHGPFKGMIYPEMASIGSKLTPKLLGSYEREIQALIEKLCSNDYSEIVDIGCAEGYYAVGLAMRITSAKVFAYDTNEEAIRLCNAMARVNSVTDRIITGAFCDPNTLRAIPLTRRALIISDCEGYEKQLFNDDISLVLARHELLIEVHDFIDIEISSVIRQRFEKSHEIASFQSVDDVTKALLYSYEELEGHDLRSRKNLLAEERPSIMEWLYMTPRRTE